MKNRTPPNPGETKSYSWWLTLQDGADFTQRNRIIALLEVSKKDWTRAEIHKFFDSTKWSMRMGSILGRVNELLGDGVIYVSGYRVDPETRRPVETLRLTEDDKQTKMF
jgi:hypothetical protein